MISLAGTDGGGKTGMYAAPNMTAYMTCLANWICFPEIRCKAGNAMRDMFTDNLDISTPAASQRLLDACNEAISLYFSRQELLNA